jgi:glycosyltransferase involved in cell wall biosynthesis
LKTGIFKHLEKYLASKSDAIIVLSELQKKELCEDFSIFPASKASVVPLGFDLTRFTENRASHRNQFRREYNIPDDYIAIGIVGRLVPIKNHQLFIRSFAELKKNHKNCTAIIVGDGESRKELEALCTELSLTIPSEQGDLADVIFTGWIREVETVYPGLDIVALSSLNEGTPVSLIEAQAAGVPIVSTDVGGISDVVLPEQSAVLSSSFEVKDYTAALEKLMSDDELRIKMAHSATEFVLQQFSIKRLCTDMASVYNTLLQNKRL